jgi:hypothetical protein
MPNTQLGDSQKVPYTLIETDAKNNPVPAAPSDSISVVSGDTTMLTVVPDVTPAAGTVGSGFLVGGAKLGTVTVTATVTHADGSIMTATDSIDIVAGAASSLAFGLGAPIPQ